jgi:hypothetical protein
LTVGAAIGRGYTGYLWQGHRAAVGALCNTTVINIQRAPLHLRCNIASATRTVSALYVYLALPVSLTEIVFHP